MIVSHDRAFLERVTERCFWLAHRKVRTLDEGFGAFDKALGGDTFQNYNQRQITINQTNNHSWANPGAIQTGRFRDVHDRMTGDLVRHFTSAMM